MPSLRVKVKNRIYTIPLQETFITNSPFQIAVLFNDKTYYARITPLEYNHCPYVKFRCTGVDFYLATAIYDAPTSVSNYAAIVGQYKTGLKDGTFFYLWFHALPPFNLLRKLEEKGWTAASNYDPFGTYGQNMLDWCFFDSDYFGRPIVLSDANSDYKKIWSYYDPLNLNDEWVSLASNGLAVMQVGIMTGLHDYGSLSPQYLLQQGTYKGFYCVDLRKEMFSRYQASDYYFNCDLEALYQDKSDNQVRWTYQRRIGKTPMYISAYGRSRYDGKPYNYDRPKNFIAMADPLDYKPFVWKSSMEHIYFPGGVTWMYDHTSDKTNERYYFRYNTFNFVGFDWNNI